jgi:hypothetical protein
MGKILLMLVAMSVLILSAPLTYAHSDRATAPRTPSVGTAINNLSRSFDGVSGLASQPSAGVLLPSADTDKRPAAALLVYLSAVLVGSIFGVVLIRRIPREL